MATQLFPKFLGAESKASRNGFDKSSRQVFSAKVGQITSPFQLHYIPGEEVKIDVRALLRTQPIETPAFTRMNQHYEFYSVNYNDLYSGFNQYVAQTEDKQLASTPNVQSLPYFNVHDFIIWLFPFVLHDYLALHPIKMQGGGTLRASSDWSPSSNLPHSLFSYSLKMFPDVSLALETLRALDLFGYGNLLPVLKLVFQRLTDYYSPLTLSSDEFMSPEQLNDFLIEEFVGPAYLVWDEFFPNVDANLWSALAYNKIFELHYRNAYYDLNFEYLVNNGDFSERNYPYVRLFNLDDMQGNKLTDFERIMCIFVPKFHQYPKDMFTGVLPSTQFGDVSVMTDNRAWLDLDITSDSSLSNNPAHYLIQQGSLEPGQIKDVKVFDNGLAHDVKFRFDPALAISVLNQRRADALQRFNENKMRAGVRVKANFMAHFGYSPKSEQGHEAYYLGSFDGDLSLNTVAATTWAEGQSLGQLGANGVGVVKGSSIRFKNNTDFGVIVCNYFIDKPSEYDAYGIDRCNLLLDKWDMPYSELQNISLKPLDILQLSLYERAFSDVNNLDIILGYLPAFIEHKTAVDLIHGEFFSSSPYVSTSNVSDIANLSFYKGIFSNFVTPRNELDFGNLLSRQYIHPNSCDNIFHVLSNSAQETDQFLINAQFDCFVVAPISVLGLPIN